MKKSSFFMAATFVLAIGSAFTTKAPLFNPTGWAKAGGVDVNGATNSANCAVQSGTNCSIVVNGQTISPVYDTEAHINNSSFILKYN